MRTVFPFKSLADSPQIPVGLGSIRAIFASFKQKRDQFYKNMHLKSAVTYERLFIPTKIIGN